MSRRLFIECTRTLNSRGFSGVGRVVKNLCAESQRQASPIFAEQVLLKRVNRKALRVFKEQFEEEKLSGIAHRLRHSFSRTVKSIARRVRSGADGHSETIELMHGDVLLLPDAYWADQHVWPWLEKQRKRGVTVAAIIYDLIPHLHPELYGSQGVAEFRKYLSHVASHADLVLAISQTVASDVVTEFPKLSPQWKSTKPVVHFPLGGTLEKTNGPVRRALRSHFERSRDTFLMVGAIEIRKNHLYALRAMRLLWESGYDASLCIIGNPGWQGEPFLKTAKEDPEFGSRLTIFHDASDAELQFAYQNSKALLFTSKYEGFGLPIVESLQFGKPTFVTNTPIHREVGQNHVVYCSLERPESLAKRIQDYSHWNDPPELRGYQATSWEDSFQCLLQLLNCHLPQCNSGVGPLDELFSKRRESRLKNTLGLSAVVVPNGSK